MNLDDLRAELDARANDVDTQARGRMAGIRAKAVARRRRRAGATMAAAVVAVAAIVGVPVVNDVSSGPGPAERPDGSDRAAVFPDTLDGDTRVASELGDQGDKKVTLTYTSDDTDLLVDFACRDLARHNREHGTSYTLHVRVTPDPRSVLVGGFYSGDYCGSAPGTGGPYQVGSAASPDEVRERWRKLGFGFRPGDRVRIELTVWNRTKPVREPFDGRIGVALYDMTDGDETEPDDKTPTDTRGEPQGGAPREPDDQTDDQTNDPFEPFEKHDVERDDPQVIPRIESHDEESVPLDDQRPRQQGPVIEHKVPQDEQAKPEDYDEPGELDGRGAMPVDPTPRMPGPRRAHDKPVSGFVVP